MKWDRSYVKIMLAVLICMLTARFSNGWIQYMSACFSTVLCMMETRESSLDTGLKRIRITVIGGLLGIVIVLLDQLFQREVLFYVMAILGLIPVLAICRMAKVGEMKCRSGCVCYLAVLVIKSGADRLEFAGLRLLGTVYGVMIAVLVSYAVDTVCEHIWHTSGVPESNSGRGA